MSGEAFEQGRFVIQRGPDDPVEPCRCGSVFAGVLFRGGEPGGLFCVCGEALDPSIVRFYELPPERRSPGHDRCSRRRIVVPKVGEEVSGEWVKQNGASRFDLFCVDCGLKDGAVSKDDLRGYRTTKKRDDDNQHQRTEVLERARHRCEMCFRKGLPLHVGHCLSLGDVKILNARTPDKPPVQRDVPEDLWNKCALCEECNLAAYGGYGDRSMSPSTYCDLVFTAPEARKMLDYGRPAAAEGFVRVYLLLFQVSRSRKEAA